LRERWLGLSVPTARVIAVAILAGAWVLSLATDLVITTPQHNETTGWEQGYRPAFPAFVVALFFSDIGGFTRFTDASDPDDVAALLNEYLGEMAEVSTSLARIKHGDMSWRRHPGRLRGRRHGGAGAHHRERPADGEGQVADREVLAAHGGMSSSPW
jgi:hypothetical protein